MEWIIAGLAYVTAINYRASTLLPNQEGGMENIPGSAAGGGGESSGSPTVSPPSSPIKKEYTLAQIDEIAISHPKMKIPLLRAYYQRIAPPDGTILDRSQLDMIKYLTDTKKRKIGGFTGTVDHYDYTHKTLLITDITLPIRDYKLDHVWVQVNSKGRHLRHIGRPPDGAYIEFKAIPVIYTKSNGVKQWGLSLVKWEVIERPITKPVFNIHAKPVIPTGNS